MGQPLNADQEAMLAHAEQTEQMALMLDGTIAFDPSVFQGMMMTALGPVGAPFAAAFTAAITNQHINAHEVAAALHAHAEATRESALEYETTDDLNAAELAADQHLAEELGDQLDSVKSEADKFEPFKEGPLDGKDPDRPGDPSRGRGDQGPMPGSAHKDAEYHVGSPQRPDMTGLLDDSYEYGSKESNLADEASWAKWGAMNEGAKLLRPDLDDATRMYSHFRENSGTPMKFDYETAYKEDSSIRANVNEKIAEAQRAAESLVRNGNTSFSMTGGVNAEGHYPATEDWKKTIGAYYQWASADVRVDGNQVTMEVTVHAEDRYNFNKGGAADMDSGTPDSVNGRFEEIGWAKPFDTSGELTRTVTWTLGEAPNATVSSGSEPERSRDPENEPSQPR
ncbi:hypothetical protein Srot_0732 [Segniliparus rotundus DSM 44985]|uniref:Uncharacterized protein n=1 Tax=Segniliparus rotundus (strain ATCC BAA-972 / CDC 1076 / CIP 108378 / DSM 44985 / JCM 13578) TaxID=640132 RepID=D6ZDE8_SEGRD|nr:type VII secretion target [Segniliparus rotundus]ADG97212.1 hypothetical protein Srot_0732 [Segniliparus rotundus DSM 44985]